MSYRSVSRRGRRRSDTVIPPEDIIRNRVGLWDYYEQRPGVTAAPKPARTFSSYLPYVRLAEIEDLPYLLRLADEMFWLCPTLWAVLLFTKFLESIIPAVTLFYSGKLLEILHAAIETRQADKSILIQTAVVTGVCNGALNLIRMLRVQTEPKIMSHITVHFEEHVFKAQARLDLPTSEDPTVQAKLARCRVEQGGAPWRILHNIIDTCGIILRLTSQLLVLVGVLNRQRNTMAFVIWGFIGPLTQWIERSRMGKSYAAILSHPDVARKGVLTNVINASAHRKELVAGDMAGYLIEVFHQTSKRLAMLADNVDPWNGPHRQPKSFTNHLFRNAIAEGPKIAFALNALRTPTSIPLSLATLTLVQGQVTSFSELLFGFLDSNTSLVSQISDIKELYELGNLPNQIQDGVLPFPNPDRKTVGTSIEFKNVSFRYPSSELYAIKNVSFKISAGQLCVIVGANGEGKSSILKLLSRLYDATEGEVLLDNEPIQIYRLRDLRRATSVLFQDFTIFPLSIRENITIGDPNVLSDTPANINRRVQEAAALGGAAEFIAKLPEGLDKSANRYDQPAMSSGPDGIAIMRAVHLMLGKKKGRSTENELSGGQMQRLALARTFMRPQSEVSLLLYDEPSASLDPQAESDLFERLRALRGSKTMVFSSHRFGYLTKQADVILYIKDSTVAEAGTHDELMNLDGGYAHLYNLQARAFA